jgi:uncharacterized protein (DUF1499 family)
MSYFERPKSNNYWHVCSNIVTIVTILLLFISVMGFRFEIFSFVFSLLTLTKYAIYTSLIALVLSLIAFGNLIGRSHYSSILNNLFNIIINIVLVVYFFNNIIALKSNPVINDISTNYDDFIEFKMYKNHNLLTDEHILLQKYGGFNKPNSKIISFQVINKTLAEVFNASQNIINEMGLKITYSNLEEGLIEAVDSSFWYGFKDDIIIRIEKLISDEIKVDVRSASRIGKSDFGVNSMRIKDFYQRLEFNLKN